MEQRHITLTFFSLSDLAAEVKRGELAVRCEAIQQDKGMGQGAPSAMREYRLILTALDGGAVLACTLPIGRVWAIFAKDQSHHAENLERAEKIVTRHLTGLGIEVRPGMYHHEADGLATASGLWRFDENKRLVPLDEKRGEVIPLECRNPRCRWTGTSEEAPYYDELDEYGCPACGGFDLRIAKTREPHPDCQGCPEVTNCKDLCLREEVVE